MATDVEVPALGESITEGTLAQWLKKPGEAVAADEPIASLETDKVSVEVPSPVAGVLIEQLAQEGDNVAVGAVRRRDRTRRRSRTRRCYHHPFAGRSSCSARISCRSDQYPGHRQGWTADQRRCDRRCAGAKGHA